MGHRRHFAGMGGDEGTGSVPPGVSGSGTDAQYAQLRALETAGFISEAFVIAADPFFMALTYAAGFEPMDIVATHAVIVGTSVTLMLAEGTVAIAAVQSLPPPGLPTASPIGTLQP